MSLKRPSANSAAMRGSDPERLTSMELYGSLPGDTWGRAAPLPPPRGIAGRSLSRRAAARILSARDLTPSRLFCQLGRRNPRQPRQTYR